ncbi:MAG: hypothetical protein JWO38_671 [Gemmataceae bacterium]|nr:hypothetical protein [Gemmataceae bacterium]
MHRVGSAAGVFVQGMLAELAVTLDECVTSGAAALARWPVERITVLDVPGLVF